MKSYRTVAVALVLALTGAAMLTTVAEAQQNAALRGTAKDEAKKPYQDYTVRARDVSQGLVGGTSPLNTDGEFTILNLSSARYLLELVNKDDKVVCTEGPFDLSQQLTRDNIVIDCNKVPAAFLILGAAGAAGITAGVAAAGGTVSASQ